MSAFLYHYMSIQNCCWREDTPCRPCFSLPEFSRVWGPEQHGAIFLDTFASATNFPLRCSAFPLWCVFPDKVCKKSRALIQSSHSRLKVELAKWKKKKKDLVFVFGNDVDVFLFDSDETITGLSCAVRHIVYLNYFPFIVGCLSSSSLGLKTDG